MTGHARLSASAAHRWMACPGSVAPGGVAGRDAALGTLAHSIAAKCFDEDASPSDFLCHKETIDGHEVEVDLEMVEGVQAYIDEADRDEHPSDAVWWEHPLTEALRRLHPDLGGTADRVRYRAADKTLCVTDFKYGAGKYVEAEGNPQLKVYALGAMLSIDQPVAEVEVKIVQPRFEGAKPVRSWKFRAVDIVDFSADLIAAAEATRQPDPPRAAGAHCTFCQKAKDCPELERKHHALVAADFADLSSVAPEKLATALTDIPLLKQRIKAIEEHAYQLACGGTAIPGFKLVEKRPVRKWKSEGEVVMWAQSQAVDPWAPRELLSPAQLEKVLADALPRGKKQNAKTALEPFVEKVSSGLALVPEHDDRPPAKQITAADFSVLA